MCSSSRYGKQLGDHHFHLCSDNRDHLKTSSIAPSIAVPLIRPSAFGTELAGPTVSQPSSVSHSSTIIEISSSTIIEISGSSSSTRIRGMEVNRPAGPMRLAGCEVVQDTPIELNERSHVSFPERITWPRSAVLSAQEDLARRIPQFQRCRHSQRHYRQCLLVSPAFVEGAAGLCPYTSPGRRSSKSEAQPRLWFEVPSSILLRRKQDSRGKKYCWRKSSSLGR